MSLKEGVKYVTWMKIKLFLGINFTLESKGVYTKLLPKILVNFMEIWTGDRGNALEMKSCKWQENADSEREAK